MRDMPDLESEEDAAKRQKGHGLKIMTPNQLITRLPILLAQKQAGNNSQKLNNEIRQITYSLYRSKNLSKTIYNHLINNTENTENSKTSDSNRFRLYFTEKIDLKGKKKIALSDLTIHYTWYNIKE